MTMVGGPGFEPGGLTVPNRPNVLSSGIPAAPPASSSTQPPTSPCPFVSSCIRWVPQMRDTAVTSTGRRLSLIPRNNPAFGAVGEGRGFRNANQVTIAGRPISLSSERLTPSSGRFLRDVRCAGSSLDNFQASPVGSRRFESSQAVNAACHPHSPRRRRPRQHCFHPEPAVHRRLQASVGDRPLGPA